MRVQEGERVIFQFHPLPPTSTLQRKCTRSGTNAWMPPPRNEESQLFILNANGALRPGAASFGGPGVKQTKGHREKEARAGSQAGGRTAFTAEGEVGRGPPPAPRGRDPGGWAASRLGTTGRPGGGPSGGRGRGRGSRPSVCLRAQPPRNFVAGSPAPRASRKDSAAAGYGLERHLCPDPLTAQGEATWSPK